MKRMALTIAGLMLSFSISATALAAETSYEAYADIQGDEVQYAVVNNSTGEVVYIAKEGKRWKTLKGDDAREAAAQMKESFIISGDALMGAQEGDKRIVMMKMRDDGTVAGPARSIEIVRAEDKEDLQDVLAALGESGQSPEAIRFADMEGEKKIIMLKPYEEEANEKGNTESTDKMSGKTIQIIKLKDASDIEGLLDQSEMPIVVKPSGDEPEIRIVKKDISEVEKWTEDGKHSRFAYLANADREKIEAFIAELDDVPVRRKRALRSVL